MATQKHLTLEDRYAIQHALEKRHSFRTIARSLDKDPTTISKEVRRHCLSRYYVGHGRISNRCIHRQHCTITNLCANKKCRKASCSLCNQCNSICADFEEELCPRLQRAPYVCNGCKTRESCTLMKSFYKAQEAHQKYEQTLSDSRTGISLTDEELAYVDALVSPLIKQNQSIHHICVHNADRLPICERTLYTLIDRCYLKARNIDLVRKPRFRLRKKKVEKKIDKACRTERTMVDYKRYLDEQEEVVTIQMDTVEGRKGGKVILTLHFTNCHLMLMYLRDHNTSQTVIDVFNKLEEDLGETAFRKLFPVVLTDNGSEFSNPKALEENQRTRIFYCDVNSPFQKGQIEKNHELIRYVLPKGTSFDGLTQADVQLLACHINSYTRKKLNDKSPTESFSFLYGDELLHTLGIELVPPHTINLSPSLFKKEGLSDGN